jgi:signal transduction histidine kinase
MTRTDLASPGVLLGDIPAPPPRRFFARWWLRAALILIVFTLVGVLEAGQSIMMQYLSNMPSSFTSALQTLVLGVADWYIWAALTPFVLFASQLFPIEQRNWPRRLLFHSVCAIVCATAVIAMMIPVVERVNQRLDFMRLPVPSGSHEVAAHLLAFRFVLYLIVYWTIVGVSHAWAYYRKYREREVHSLLLESRLAQTQLQVLKMQLQPHFLFNTLNAISALMHQDVELADQMLARLGQLLRTTLESAGTQEVALKQELEFVELYLEIEQARFGSRLTVRMDVTPETMDACVPNLILQPLVENAVRHGIAPRSGPGLIEIRTRRENGTLRVEVMDNGPGLKRASTNVPREGVGLANTRARLQQLYPDQHQLTLANRAGGGVVVALCLPFRENPNGSADPPQVGAARPAAPASARIAASRSL